jgi:hypothetical protein
MKKEKHPSKYGKSLPKIEKKSRPPPAAKEEITSKKHPAAQSKSFYLRKLTQHLSKEQETRTHIKDCPNRNHRPRRCQSKATLQFTRI